MRMWVVALIFACSQSWAKAPALPKLHLATNSITISGLSSGGFMAVQMLVSYSSLISGLGSFAGGIYWCAEGDLAKATGQCMSNPKQIQVNRYINKAQIEASQNNVDPLVNLAHARIYLYAGTHDTIVPPLNTSKLAEFFHAFVPGQNIHVHMDTPSGHGFPTLDFGTSCGESRLPFILNCKVDAAGEMLTQLYGPLAAAGTFHEENLQKFNQTEFAPPGAKLYPFGFVYIPQACKAGGCRLHIALHGCEQNPDFVGESFARHTGLNEWAENNHIVVLYPQAAKSVLNPNACWDWYGYTGANYYNKKGLQIQALKAMIDHLTEP